MDGPRLLPLPFGGERSIEGGADGCRLGADGRCDLARYGRPAVRAALARSGERTLGAAKYEAIRFVGPLLRRPAVRRGAIRERAGNHRVHAPGAQPSVKVGLHAPSIGRIATIVAADRAQRIGRGEVVESCPRAPRGPWRAGFGPFSVTWRRQRKTERRTADVKFCEVAHRRADRQRKPDPGGPLPLGRERARKPATDARFARGTLPA